MDSLECICGLGVRESRLLLEFRRAPSPYELRNTKCVGWDACSACAEAIAARQPFGILERHTHARRLCRADLHCSVPGHSAIHAILWLHELLVRLLVQALEPRIYRFLRPHHIDFKSVHHAQWRAAQCSGFPRRTRFHLEHRQRPPVVANGWRTGCERRWDRRRFLLNGPEQQVRRHDCPTSLGLMCSVQRQPQCRTRKHTTATQWTRRNHKQEKHGGRTLNETDSVVLRYNLQNTAPRKRCARANIEKRCSWSVPK